MSKSKVENTKLRHVYVVTNVFFCQKINFSHKILLLYFFNFHEKAKTERKQILLKKRSMTHEYEEKCIINPLLFPYVYIKEIYDHIPVHFYKK